MTPKLDWEKIQQAEIYLIELCPKEISTDKLTAYLGNKPMEEELIIDLDNQIEAASKAHLKELANLFLN